MSNDRKVQLFHSTIYTFHCPSGPRRCDSPMVSPTGGLACTGKRKPPETISLAFWLAFTDQKSFVSSPSVLHVLSPYWRIWWWMGVNSRYGQNASSCGLFLVNVLRVCPLPHWCYVKWLKTKTYPTSSHVAPMEGSGLGSKADWLTHMQKWEKSQWGTLADYILRVVWEISFGFFILRKKPQ